ACLRRAAEAIRMGQDGAASPRWELRRIGVDVPHSARPLVLRCAAAASPEERREAADQLARLAATPPPIAVAVRRQVAARGADLAEEAALELEHAVFGGFGEAYRYGLRGAVERLGALDAPDAAPDPRRYPEGLRAALPEARIVTQTDAAAQASLRALAIAVAALAEGLPARPRALDDPRLADPFTGEPFEWTREESGGRLRSPGPSGLGVLDGPIELRVSPGEG
ncbi:MAG TPA: hypothetical protein RMG45_07410, partial [Polyangiaceae bacterium LLY-WYZ-15_(1-7)]|nr:hypothetical protein [Polyangiaceae bacterium LLY-WYZ-15_(1-7)]